MSDRIEPGDLVVVLRNHCSDHNIGQVGYVVATGCDEEVDCVMCGQALRSTRWLRLEGMPKDEVWPVAYCKRIPPAEELDEVRREEELTA